MLAMRPNCECCDRDLPADSHEALLCSFECTWCRFCAWSVLGAACLNCGGDLAARPTRVGAELDKHPASAERVVSQRPECVAAREAHTRHTVADD